MSNSSTNPVLVAAKSAWADETGSVLVPDGDNRASVLVAVRGIRVMAKKLARFANADEFFITQDEYHAKFPAANPIMFVPVGESTQEGTEKASEGAPALDASNSVVVERLGDSTQDPPEEEETAPTRNKKKVR